MSTSSGGETSARTADRGGAASRRAEARGGAAARRRRRRSPRGDLAGLLFGFLLYREIRDGNIERGGCLKLGCLVLVGIGVVLGLVDELLYVAVTRATTQLVVIAPPELAGRLR